MSTIRVLLVDDESLVRHALSAYFKRASDLEIVGEASHGVEAIEAAAELHPDVVLMDIRMPRMGGVEATRLIIEKHPEMRVLAMTTFGSLEAAIPMLQAGASGFLVKDTEPAEIIAAVRNVHAGVSVLSAAITQRFVAALAPKEGGMSSLEPSQELTAREHDTVVLLARGLSNAEIAQELHLSEATVKTHLSRVIEKWQVRDRMQVLIQAVRTGVVTL